MVFGPIERGGDHGSVLISKSISKERGDCETGNGDVGLPLNRTESLASGLANIIRDERSVLAM